VTSPSNLNPAVLNPARYYLLITDEQLQVMGNPIIDWTQLDITLRRNQPDSSMFIMPAHPWVVDQLDAGHRVVAIRRLPAAWNYQTDIITAGPVEKIMIEQSDDGGNSGVGTLTVNWTDDSVWLAARCTYPDPTQAPSDQTTDHWTWSGNAESALRTLANMNAGPGALAARRVPTLALGATAAVGGNVTVTADRMEPLSGLMRDIATAGGDIGFRTRQVGSQILFEVYAPRDLSTSVRFSWGLGNLKYLMHEKVAPKTTTAIVGGQGEGADRYLIERTNATDETAWGRFETLVSRPGNSPLQSLQDDGDKQLGQDAMTNRIASNVADTAKQRFGVNYGLSDIVSIETGHGEVITDNVETVHIQVYATSGEYVQATIGSQAEHTDPIWVQKLREIDARLSKVERVVKPAAVP
jgi:hypothetical protein